MMVEAEWTLFFIRSCHNKTLTKKEKKMMSDYSDYIQDIVQTKKVGLCILCSLPHLMIIVHYSELNAHFYFPNVKE